jgi:hypothetical protein
VVESVDALDGTPEGKVAGQEHVGPVEGHEQEAVRRPRPDARDFGQSRLDLVVGHVRQGLVAETTIDQPLRQRPQRLALAGGEAAGPQHVGIRGEQLGGSRQPSSEMFRDAGHDRPRRPHRDLLAGDLEDQRPEGIEGRELVEPSPRAEVRVRIDDPAEHRVGLAQKGPRPRVSDRCSGGVHSSTRRSVSTI